MPKTGQTAAQRRYAVVGKAMKEGLLVLNGFDYERTSKAQKSEYHKPSMAYRTKFGDKRK